MEAVTQFQAPKTSFRDLDAEVVAKMITAASDIAVIVDGQGIVRDVALGSDELTVEGHDKWLGQPWIETVTVESRPKLEALLREAAANTSSRGRQINYPTRAGADVPVMYSAVPLGPKGSVVAVGRDLQAMSAMQLRLVEAQQAMERDYARLRQTETRYRLLFQVTAEAVLIVDASNLKIVEVNPAAARLLGKSAKRLVGEPIADSFSSGAGQELQGLFATVRAAGRAEPIEVGAAKGDKTLLVSASQFRQEATTNFLVRLSPPGAAGASEDADEAKARLSAVIEKLPDGFVVTNPNGEVLAANRAFIEMVQAASETQVCGESLERWLGRPGVDMRVLLSNLREHDEVRLFATTLRGEHAGATEVEISAVAVPDGDQPCIGFSVRDIGRRLTTHPTSQRGLPRSVEQLTELVGRMDLKDIVRETTDVIERMCIEAALELTGDNRVSAAEMLGVSRQSLYVKLRRYGLGDLASEAES